MTDRPPLKPPVVPIVCRAWILTAAIAAFAVAATCAWAEERSPAWKLAEAQIAEAHRYDYNYAPKGAGDRQKAIAAYEKSLGMEPDYSQRLHILFRLGQLQGTCYMASRGEKPDYGAAIRYHTQIVEAYPASEPMALKSMNSIASYYLATKNPELALQWFRKTLEPDIEPLETSSQPASEADDMIETAPGASELYPEANPTRMTAGLLRWQAKQARFYQEVAVKSVGAVAWRVDPKLFEPEMRRVASRHPGSSLATLALERIEKAKARNQPVWKLPNGLENMEPAPTESVRRLPASQAAAPGPAAATAPTTSYRNALPYTVLAGLVICIYLLALVLRRKRKEPRQ